MIDYIFQLEPDLLVVRAEGLEDMRAVWGARTSRTILLENKTFADTAEFLEKNLLNYGHASIGDMSLCSVFHRGFGWLTSYALMDDPLFFGQEVSTRAVNTLSIFPSRCYDSDIKFEESHQKFSQIFRELSADVSSKGYCFDSIRWSLPGTLQTGVTIMMNARTFVRRLEYLQHDFFTRTREKYLRGLKFCAPHLTNALYGKKRHIAEKRLYFSTHEIEKKFSSYEEMIKIYPPKELNLNTYSLSNFEPRIIEKTMLDPYVNSLGLFKIVIYCSIAEARDWFRHRTVMPWDKKILTINKKPFINIFYENYEKYALEIDSYLNEYFLSEKNFIGDLYGLPYGTMLEISGYTTLNYLVYMLELRSQASGANLEYKTKAQQGMKILAEILGPEACQYFSFFV